MSTARSVTVQVNKPSAVSGTRPRLAHRLTFISPHDSDALAGVEFQMNPSPRVLCTLCETLESWNVRIADSATRVTSDVLSQRFSLTEPDGGPLTGERRQRVQALFIEALARAAAEDENQEE